MISAPELISSLSYILPSSLCLTANLFYMLVIIVDIQFCLFPFLFFLKVFIYLSNPYAQL